LNEVIFKNLIYGLLQCYVTVTVIYMRKINAEVLMTKIRRKKLFFGFSTIKIQEKIQKKNFFGRFFRSRGFFFRVCHALVTRIKTLSRFKQIVINDDLNIRFKRFNYF
jgi:hypothetical protein